ncbi:MAG: carbohydrate binding domain-containing protein [Candidatus Poribacteria bacterium]|nr:carbohydrate binding domain-containing protein [Candidatus Poribacteria bacterium]
MNRVIFVNVVLTTMLIGFSAFAGTPQELGKWEKGELLLENHSFEDDLAAWELEDGTCCDRGGEYKMEIDKKNPQHGEKCLKIIGIKATGTNWHAKVKQRNVSMEKGKTYTVIFWARSEKPRQVSLNIQEQQDPWTFWQGGDINLTGPEWEEYFVTFNAKEDVARNMWVGLSIAQSDVDFWLDNFRYFEGEPEDDLSIDEPFPVDAKEKLTTQWASVKTERF